MARVLKILLIVLAGVIGIVVIAAVALLLFFDPNDYREEISARVAEATGRKFAIEGELGLSLFPWIAVEVGRSRLGNAAGFSDRPFATFEEARLSVRLVPLVFRQEVTVGTASLDSLVLNLEVAADGSTNWEDLAQADETAPEQAPPGESPLETLDIANVNVSNAQVFYTDAEAGTRYAITDLSLETGRIAPDVPFDVAAEFDFEAEPGELAGRLALDATTTLGGAFETLQLNDLSIDGELSGVAAEPTAFNLGARSIAIDTNAETVTVGEIDLGALGVQLAANVQPFSYAGTPEPQATVRVEPFSLKNLMSALGTEPPVTADPEALSRVSFNAEVAIGETVAVLCSMALTLDDTTLTGEFSYPLTVEGLIEFDLAADSINLDAYMAPADESAAGEEANPDDVELPVEMIRALEARGRVTLERATLAGMLFENLELGVDSRNGKLRLHPVSADLFDGEYEGDVRIDASAEIPSISVNEKITGVSLTPLASAMFEQENLSGTIAGSFELSGSGNNFAEIRSDLDGNMAFELADGAWEGTDVWHQLRSARALFRQEPPPERRNPPRTEFSSVIATGTVTDGIFRNEDLLAELPFLQLTGNGTVNLVEAQIDYSLQARVLERPEFVGDVSEEEISDFTQAVIPLSVTGDLASPSIRPDIGGMVEAEARKVVDEKREELQQRVLNKLLGNDEPEADEGEAADDQQEEKLQDRLKRLFDN